MRKQFAVLIALFLIFSFGLWVGPRVSEADRWLYCTSNIKINANIGQSLSCDTLGFVWAANDLSLLFDKQSARQDRPGSVLFAHAVSQPLYWQLNHTVKSDETVELEWRNRTETSRDTMKTIDFLARYIGFIVLNLSILYAASLVYLRACGIPIEKRSQKILGGSAFLLTSLILINNVTKLFLWSAHTQLFSLLSAVSSVYFFKAIQTTDKPERMYFGLAFFYGIGTLFYGLFVIPITIVGLGYLWRNRQIFSAGFFLFLKFTLRNALAVLIFATPYAIWYTLILLLNGEFYSYDTETFRGFLWLNDLASQSGWDKALLAMITNFFNMIRGGIAQGWGIILLLGIAIYMAKKLKVNLTGASLLLTGASLYIFLTSLFFAYYGITPLRISYSLVTALVPCLGFVVHRIEQKIEVPERFFWATGAGLFCYTLYQVAKFGPYS